MLWNVTKSKCIAIHQSLQMYFATKENDFMLSLDPISFWKTTSKFDSALRHLATMIFKIKGHAVAVETLFSGMSYTKTKTCNHMNMENLNMFIMIRNYLARSISDSEKNQKWDNNLKNVLTENIKNISFKAGEYGNIDTVISKLKSEISPNAKILWNITGGQKAFLIEKLFNLTELKKSKIHNVVECGGMEDG